MLITGNNKSFSFLSVLAFSLLSALIIVGQIPPASGKPENKKAKGKSISNLLQSRNLSNLALLSQSDISSSSRVTSANGDPCSAAVRIDFGQSIMGELASNDCQLDDGSYADFYFFEGLAGEEVTITMASGVFDTYLGLANESGTFIIEDDDSGGGFSAQIVATLPESGLYLILANSFLPNELGSYSLSLGGGPPCTFIFSPSSAEIPSVGGTFMFALTTQPRCYWRASSVFSEVTTNSSGLGSGTVTYTVTPNDRNQDRVLNVGVRNTYFNIRQAAIGCEYSFEPTAINVGPAALSGSFLVTATSGCIWGSTARSDFISASGGALGNGTADYQISNNNGADRTGVIEIGNRVFTVNQTGLNCTFAVSPTLVNVSASGMSGSYTIQTQTGCTWFLAVNQNWVSIQTGSGSGPATIPFVVHEHTDASPRSAAIQLFYSLDSISRSFSTYIDQSPVSVPRTVSGRVLTPVGVGMRNTVVSLIDANGVRRNATTSSFGTYSFPDVTSGGNYTITVSSKRYRFTSRSMMVNTDLANIDFVGLE